MQQIRDFSDYRLKGLCAYCGSIVGTSKDHVPSKGLLRRPFPPNLPVTWACRDCNSSFAADEEYFRLFLHSVLMGTTDPERHRDVARSLRQQARLRDRIRRSRLEPSQLTDEPQPMWLPEMDRIERVVKKNAYGHVYHEYGSPIGTEPAFVGASPLQSMPVTLRHAFATIRPLIAGWPEVGSRMMTRVLEGQDMTDGWIIVQERVYRYSVDQWDGGTRVRSVLHEYLATAVCWEDA